jgi:hypothetical protein
MEKTITAKCDQITFNNQGATVRLLVDPVVSPGGQEPVIIAKAVIMLQFHDRAEAANFHYDQELTILLTSK